MKNPLRRSRLLLTLPLLAIASVCLAGIPTNRFTITASNSDGKVSYLAVENGKLVLGRPAPLGDGGLDMKDTPDRWYVMGTKIKSSVGGGYLAYDHSGDHPAVFLAPKPDGEGTHWIVKRPEGRLKRKNEKRSLDEEWGTLQAASGPLKGWFLDVEEKEEQRDDGTLVTVRRFVLSKEPKWNVEVGRIYTHK